MLPWLLAGALLLGGAPQAQAQNREPPQVAISPNGGVVGTASTVTVTVTSRTGNLYDHSIKAWINGQTTTFNGAGSSPASGDTWIHSYTGVVPLAVGENTLRVEGCWGSDCTPATAVFTRLSAARMQPAVSLAFRPDRRIPNPAEARATYSTTPYISRDVPRSVSLVYLGGQAQPQGLVEVDASDWSSDPATTMSIQVLNAAGVVVAPEVFYRAGQGATRLVARWDASSYATSALLHTIVVRSWWADGTFTESQTSARVVVVNERDSHFGAGWSMAGLPRLHIHDRSLLVLTEGTGGAGVYQRNGQCIPYSNATSTLTRCWYTPPAGDFTAFYHDSVHNTGERYYVRVYPDYGITLFYPDGRASYHKDRYGNQTTFTWTSLAVGVRLTNITDPAGQSLVLKYHANGDSHHGKLLSVRDPGARVSYFSYYDGYNNLTHVQDPDQGGASFTYGTSLAGTRSRLESWKDRAGGTSNLEYDHAGLVARILSPSVAIGSTGTLQRPTVTMRAPASRVLPAGATTLAAPAPRVTPANAWYVTYSPRGDSTMVLLDSWTQPSRTRDPQGRISVSLRDALGRDSMEISALGDTTVYGWNGANLTRAISGAGRRDLSYGSFSQLTLLSAGRHSQHFWYDARGSLDSTRISSGTGRRMTLRYTNDAYGRRLTQTDSVGRVTLFAYQSGGSQNLASVTRPGNAVERYTYDAHGRRTGVVNALGDSSSIQYDLINRPTLLTDPLGNTTRQQYGAAFLDSLTDPESQRHAFRRNVLGWDTATVDPRGQVTRSRYAVDGQAVHTTNRRGQVVTAVHDAQGRVTQRVADGAVTTLEYDPAGRFMVFTNAESRDTTWLDAQGRKVREVAVRNGVRREVSAEWGANESARTRVWYGGDGVRYSFLTQSLMAGEEGGDTLWLPENESWSPFSPGTSPPPTRFSSRADGVLAWLRLPNGIRTDYGYSSNGPWITSIAFSNSLLQGVLGVTYQRDLLGRVTRATQGADYRVHGYDRAGRLTRSGPVITTTERECGYDDRGRPVCYNVAIRDSSGIRAFTWDSAGNPTHGGALVEAGNRLTRLGEYTMEYDADGNLTHRYRNGVLEQTLTWNSLGQLTSVWTSGVGTTSFGYDGVGRRVRKTAPSGAVTQYVYDGDHIAIEMDGAGSIVATYTYYLGVDQPHSMRRGGQRYYYIRDHQGSVTALVDAAGTLVNRYEYDAWGNAERATEGVPNPFRFTGREFDAETGLYYYRARYYDPRLGRFISQDPSGLDGGVNLYAYVGNDPVNRKDPTGQIACPSHLDNIRITRSELEQLREQSGGLWESQMRQMGCEFKVDGHVPPRPDGFLSRLLNSTRTSWERWMRAERNMRAARARWVAECRAHAQDAIDQMVLTAGNASGLGLALEHKEFAMGALAGIGVSGVMERLKWLHGVVVKTQPSLLVDAMSRPYPPTQTVTAAGRVGGAVALYEAGTLTLAGLGAWIADRSANGECADNHNAF